MKKGEKALFTFPFEYAYGIRGMPPKIPKRATLIYEVELLSFNDYIKSKWEMNLNEKVISVSKLKEEGVSLFKEKKIPEARVKFEEAITYLEHLAEKDLTEEINDKRFSLLLNIANCLNNLKEWALSIKRVNEALKIKESAKCFYYRGNALMSISNFPEAEEDFKKLGELMPDDPVAKQCLVQLERKISDYKNKEKSLFKSFLKGSLYDDVPHKMVPEIKGERSIPKEINPNNPKCFFEIKVGQDEEIRRIEFELFKDAAPMCTENFRRLCIGDTERENMKLHYKGSIFHRIIKNFMAQGGDFEFGAGTGGCSIYGRRFDDEPFTYRHEGEGILSMANAGPHSNGSQFFITFKGTEWLDGKHVVFGRVIKGMEVVRMIEKVEIGEDDMPKFDVKIVECGEITQEENK